MSAGRDHDPGPKREPISLDLRQQSEQQKRQYSSRSHAFGSCLHYHCCCDLQGNYMNKVKQVKN